MDDDLVDELDTLATVLAARPDHADVAKKFEWLLDTLVDRGQLADDDRQRASKIRAERSSVQEATRRLQPRVRARNMVQSMR